VTRLQCPTSKFQTRNIRMPLDAFGDLSRKTETPTFLCCWCLKHVAACPQAAKTIWIAPHRIPPSKQSSAPLSSMAMTVVMVLPIEKALFPPIEQRGIGLQVEV